MNKEIIEELYMQGDWAVKMMHDPTAWKELAIQALDQKDKEKDKIVNIILNELKMVTGELISTDILNEKQIFQKHVIKLEAQKSVLHRIIVEVNKETNQ